MGPYIGALVECCYWSGLISIFKFILSPDSRNLQLSFQLRVFKWHPLLIPLQVTALITAFIFDEVI